MYIVGAIVVLVGVVVCVFRILKMLFCDCVLLKDKCGVLPKHCVTDSMKAYSLVASMSSCPFMNVPPHAQCAFSLLINFDPVVFRNVRRILRMVTMQKINVIGLLILTDRQMCQNRDVLCADVVFTP